jgi:hypothetical protein
VQNVLEISSFMKNAYENNISLVTGQEDSRTPISDHEKNT